MPLLAAILTSFALFRAQNERLARELVAQKAASAELLLREEVERRREAVRELAASAPVVVNLDLGLDLAASWMVGDGLGDVQAGRAAGCRTILLARVKVQEIERFISMRDSAPHFLAASLSEALEIIRSGKPPSGRTS